MKRILSTLLYLVLVITVFAHAVSADAADKTCFLPQAAAQPFSDGDYALGYVWSAVPVSDDSLAGTDIFEELTQELKIKDLMFVSLSWSKTALYADFILIDDSIEPTGDVADLNNSDSVELVINKSGVLSEAKHYYSDVNGNLMFVEGDNVLSGTSLDEFSVVVEAVSDELSDTNFLALLANVDRRSLDDISDCQAYRIKMTVPMELALDDTLYIGAAMHDASSEEQSAAVTYSVFPDGLAEGKLCPLKASRNIKDEYEVKRAVSDIEKSRKALYDTESIKNLLKIGELEVKYGLGVNTLLYKNPSEKKCIEIHVSEINDSFGMLGDVDEDNNITASDALYVLQTAVGKKEKTDVVLSLGDADFNNEITASDALLILQRAVNKICGFTYDAYVNYINFMKLSYLEDYSFTGNMIIDSDDGSELSTRMGIYTNKGMVYTHQRISIDDDEIGEMNTIVRDGKMYVLDMDAETYTETTVVEEDENDDLSLILGDDYETVYGYDNGEPYVGIKAVIPASAIGEEYEALGNVLFEMRVAVSKESGDSETDTTLYFIMKPVDSEEVLKFRIENVYVGAYTGEYVFDIYKDYTKVEQLQ